MRRKRIRREKEEEEEEEEEEMEEEEEEEMEEEEEEEEEEKEEEEKGLQSAGDQSHLVSMLRKFGSLMKYGSLPSCATQRGISTSMRGTSSSSSSSLSVVSADCSSSN